MSFAQHRILESPQQFAITLRLPDQIAIQFSGGKPQTDQAVAAAA
jgi:hypothetical protein